MSTQYGTLSHRKAVQVPMWLIVALVVGMVAIGAGYAVEQIQGRGSVATSTVKSFPDTQVAAREGGAVLPGTGQTAYVFPRGLETSGVIPTVDAPVFPGGLETSGVTPPTSHVIPQTSQPIVINGEICHQCR
jgi:hypothetical protein